MKILLDTHLLIWSLNQLKRVSHAVMTIISDPENDVLFSAVSVWEIAIKHRQARADFYSPPELVRQTLVNNGGIAVPATAAHGIVAGGLPLIHKDPFDRMLIAQAMVEGALLLTSDEKVARYPGPIRRM